MIRRASQQDIPRIAEILVTTWQQSLRGVVGDDYLDAIDTEHQQQRHDRTYRNENVGYWVYDVGGIAVGFIAGGLIRDAIGSADCELYAIYVLPEHQGKGAGTGLYARLRAYCLERTWNCIGVSVLADNPSVGFYRSLGFREIEVDLLTLGNRQYEQAKMVARLADG